MGEKAEETYDRRCADVYDQWFGYFDEAAVDVLFGARSEKHVSVYELPA